MKIRKVSGVDRARRFFNKIRYDPVSPYEHWDLDKLRKLNKDILETIERIQLLLRSTPPLTSKDEEKCQKVKRILHDFQMSVIMDIQKREQELRHSERIEHIWDPKPRSKDSFTPNYGVNSPLKGTNLLKEIPNPEIFDPSPRRD